MNVAAKLIESIAEGVRVKRRKGDTSDRFYELGVPTLIWELDISMVSEGDIQFWLPNKGEPSYLSASLSDADDTRNFYARNAPVNERGAERMVADLIKEINRVVSRYEADHFLTDFEPPHGWKET